MDQYAAVSYELARRLTLRYSSSFGQSSLLFHASIRKHIFAIYGLARIADEIVDTYQGIDMREQLDQLEQQTYTAIRTGYSSNPIIYAFALTAAKYNIATNIIAPFFTSMRTDIDASTFTEETYKSYIHGSAEVIGLMCLKVFCKGDESQYEQLAPGASALGSAYQKINFLRDFASDYHERQRVYFPGASFADFSEQDKQAIIDNIASELAFAERAIGQLPRNARTAVGTSFDYYTELFVRLQQAPVAILKTTRIRVPNSKKLFLFIKSVVTRGLPRE